MDIKAIGKQQIIMVGIATLLFVMICGISISGYMYISNLQAQIDTLRTKQDKLSKQVDSVANYVASMDDTSNEHADTIASIIRAFNQESSQRVESDKAILDYIDNLKSELTSVGAFNTWEANNPYGHNGAPPYQ